MQCSSVDLPGTRRSHDRGVRAALELDVDAVERADLGFALAVDLGRACTARAATAVVGGLVVVTCHSSCSLRGARYGIGAAGRYPDDP